MKLQAFTHSCDMKSLFLITSLLVCNLAIAQIAVPTAITSALPAGPISSALAAGPVSSVLAGGHISSLLAGGLISSVLAVPVPISSVLSPVCTQEPIRGLVNFVYLLPPVSGLLACSTFNKKFVTATGRCRALRYAWLLALREI